MPPMVDEISADLSLSRAAMGSILGAWAFIYIFTAIPAGALVDRIGLRRSIMVGALSIAASLALRSAAGGAVSLFAAVAVFGVGGPLVSIGTPKLIATLFEQDRRRLPTGVAVASPGIGSALGLALADPVLLPLFDDSWRAVLALAAVVAVAAALYWMWASPDADQRNVHNRASGPLVNRSVLGRLARLTSMRWVLFICLFSFAYGHGLSGWLPEILTDGGQSENTAGLLSAMTIAVSILGSLVIARLVPDRRRPAALATVFAILAMGVIGLNIAATAPLVGVLLVIGFTRAGAIPLMFLELMNDPDISLSDVGAATGLFFAVGEVGGFFSPWMLGAIAQNQDGFGTATLVLAGFCLLSLIGSIGLLRFRRNQSVDVVPQVAKT